MKDIFASLKNGFMQFMKDETNGPDGKANLFFGFCLAGIICAMFIPSVIDRLISIFDKNTPKQTDWEKIIILGITVRYFMFCVKRLGDINLEKIKLSKNK